MEKSLLLRRTVFYFLFSLLLFPLLFLGFHIPFHQLYWDPFLVDVFKGALTQTFLSLLFCLFLGFFGALSLSRLKSKMSASSHRILCFVVVSPCFIPPIVLVLLVAKSLSFLPTGLVGVVFYHVVMNVGLVSYLLHKQMELKSQRVARDSLVAGVPALRFILKGLLPELKKDILLLVFYFFVLFFFSFSIPFLVGGSVYGGFEVFIYEKILLFGMWGEAIQYSLYLFFILLILSRFLDQEDSGEIWTGQGPSFLGSMSNSFSIIFPLVPVFLLCLGLSLIFLKSGWMLNMDSIFPLVHGTWFISLLTGLQIFFYLSALSFAYLPEKSGKWLLSLVYPGWVIVGFAFLLLPGDSAFLSLIKISSAQALLYLPFVYRLSFHQKLKDLKKQMVITRTLPTPWAKTFKQVVFPQVLPQMAFLSGLCSLWAAGDFAITGLLIDSQHSGSLAYEIKELMSNYRLEKALLYMPSLLLSSLLVFLLFSGITYVSRSKDLS